jgi:hypothetical protein
MYYRGMPEDCSDEDNASVTCYAESSDGIHWKKPDLGIHEINGTMNNNVLLMNDPPYLHNFSPFIDTRPGVPADERYKALGGVSGKQALAAFSSPDGIHWRPWGPRPIYNDLVSPTLVFDSQNLAFWSDAEQQYVLYYRMYDGTIRTIARATSPDFLHWMRQGMMRFSNDPPTLHEQFYTNQTTPYFRAPHIYISLAARFMEGRSVFKPSSEQQSGLSSWVGNDCSDVVLMSTRGGDLYDRTFPHAFVRPGPNPLYWTSRSNYSALGVIQTGPTEMSLFVQRKYGLTNHHLERLALRLDGFSSLSAGHKPGELLTKPLIFSGKTLEINHSTSAAGRLRVEIQDHDGKPISGFVISDCPPIIGDEIARVVRWSNGTDVSRLAGKPVRLRFQMKEANLFSLRFTPD